MSGFYTEAVELDAKMTPFADKEKLEPYTIDEGTHDDNVKGAKLRFYKSKEGHTLHGVHSIMNENMAINYRTIFNAYPIHGEGMSFTEFSDYERCISRENNYILYLKDKKNPTYSNILKYYDDENFDKHGLSRYKIQDFIYLKYFNQIPNNYMITLRRYTRPVEDHVFGLDMNAQQINMLNGYSDQYFAIATAVTYMGAETGNKLSDILKFDYGATWEEKTAQIEALQSSDGGLAAQMTQRGGVLSDVMKGQASFGQLFGGAGLKSAFTMSAMCLGKGVSVNQAIASQHAFEGDEFNQRYGNEFKGDVNVINKVKMRARGLTFTNSFSLIFEYSLKSLKCVNPKIAMIDILSNFLILTGNYGNFWGGATIFYGQKNIAPQYGDPSLLRQGKYGAYMSSLWKDVKQGFGNLAKSSEGKEEGNVLGKILNVATNVLKGGFTALIGNIFGGNVGVAGQSQVPKALLSGAPSGEWHLTIGNPLDPIAMMGNLAVTKTTVQFNDVLGYDDFPTEIKFTVNLEHARPRDNAHIESMFNGGKGRFYSFKDSMLEKSFHSVNTMSNFKGGNGGTQEANSYGQQQHPRMSNERAKMIGGILNG